MSVCSLQNFIQKVWKENAFTASLLALEKCHKTNIIKTFILICIFKNHIYSNKRKNTIFRSSLKREMLICATVNVRYFPKDLFIPKRQLPKSIFPYGNFPNAISQAATFQICSLSQRSAPLPFLVASLIPYCSLLCLRRPNLTFGKMPLRKYLTP